ncbi:MAG: LamG domain-containing protein [Spirochaetales bacterium]|nr:LamG domain-containing protein [Spirochaetales bacterium]
MIRTNHRHVIMPGIVTCILLLFCLPGCPTGTPFDPELGLIHYYPFSGDASDQGSVPKDGTLNGATPAADRFGTTDSAYSFSGADTIALAYFAPPAEFTLSAWVNTADTSGTILCWRELPSSPGTDGESLGVGGDKLSHSRKNGAFSWSVESAASINTGAWIHVAVVKSGDTYSLYINGSPDGSASDTSVLTLNDLTIGYNLAGVIDEVRVYDRALSASEVNELYRL